MPLTTIAASELICRAFSAHGYKTRIATGNGWAAPDSFSFRVFVNEHHTGNILLRLSTATKDSIRREVDVFVSERLSLVLPNITEPKTRESGP